MSINLYLFNQPRILINDINMGLSRRKATALFAYLAITDQSHTRETLANLFWPELSTIKSLASLRTSLGVIRRELSNELLSSDRQNVGISSSVSIWVDVIQFRSKLNSIKMHPHKSHEICPNCVTVLTDAVKLYRGDFMKGFTLRYSPEFDDWQSFQTNRLSQDVCWALEKLTSWHIAYGHYLEAARYARHWLDIDFLNETAYQQLMHAYFRLGQQSNAINAYHDYRDRLRDELDIDPLPETKDLYQQILSGKISDGWLSDTKSLIADRPSESNVIWKTNIPNQPTKFVGREQEITRILEMVVDPTCRLLTIFGQGGIGKTRLAIKAAEEISQQEKFNFYDGIFFVPLGQISSKEFLASSIASKLDFDFYGKDNPTDQLINYLREKHFLLILDGYEHLIDTADYLAEILQQAAGIKIILTTRVRVNLQWEWCVGLGGLSYPREVLETGKSINDITSEYSAIELFMQCISKGSAKLKKKKQNMEQIISLCQYVEGMPLALELAAAWNRTLPIQGIIDEFVKNADILTIEMRDMPKRHRSMQAVFDYSWRLLTPEEKEIFRKLSLFQGGFSIQTAEDIVGRCFTALTSLCDKSFINQGEEGRFMIHSLLRQFGEHKLLKAEGKKSQTLEKLSAYFMDYLAVRQDDLKGKRQKEAINEIEIEFENIKYAWNWVVSNRKFQLLKTSIESMHCFFDICARYTEGNEFLENAINQLETTIQEEGNQDRELQLLLGRLVIRRGLLIFHLGEYQDAKESTEYSLEFHVQSGGNLEAAMGLQCLADIYRKLGNFSAAHEKNKESIQIYKKLDSKFYLATAINNHGVLYANQGNYGTAERNFKESIKMCREIGDRRGIARALNNLGLVNFLLGNPSEAEDYYMESYRILEEIGHKIGQAVILNCLGDIALNSGKIEKARELYLDALKTLREKGEYYGIILTMNDLGIVTNLLGDHKEAWDYFHKSLSSAWTLQIIPQCLEALIGFATVLESIGSKQSALDLITFVIQHPSLEHAIREKANVLLETLKDTIPTPDIDAAMEQNKSNSLEDIVESYLLRSQLRITH